MEPATLERGDGTDSCNISSAERVSCRTVEGEGGTAVRECVRTREVLRRCLGRPPEVLESQTVTTREELPTSSAQQRGHWSMDTWTGSSGAAGPAGPSWGAGWSGMGPFSGPEGLNRGLFQGPFSLENGMIPGHGDAAGSASPHGDSAVGPDASFPGPSVQELLAGAEASVRSALGQLGYELNEFRPFRGLPELFGLPADGPGAGGAEAPNSAAHLVKEEESEARGWKLPEFGKPRRPKRNLYDDLAKDFEEV